MKLGKLGKLKASDGKTLSTNSSKANAIMAEKQDGPSIVANLRSA